MSWLIFRLSLKWCKTSFNYNESLFFFFFLCFRTGCSLCRSKDLRIVVFLSHIFDMSGICVVLGFLSEVQTGVSYRTVLFKSLPKSLVPPVTGSLSRFPRFGPHLIRFWPYKDSKMYSCTLAEPGDSRDTKDKNTDNYVLKDN